MLNTERTDGARALKVTVHDPFHPTRNREVLPIFEPTSIRSLAPQTTRPFVIYKNGQVMLRRDWDELIEDGDLMLVAMLPQGGDDGGSDVLRLVLMIIVIIVAWEFAPALGGVLGVGEGAAAAIIGLAGSMLVNAMLPPAKAAGLDSQGQADWKSASPTYNLSAQGNQARLEGVIPEHFGRHMAYLDFASAPYLEYEGNEQYLYQLFCLGVGEYDVEAIRIEDSPIASFEEIQYQIIPPGQAVTLFPSDVLTSVEVSGQEAFTGTEIGPFVANAAGTAAIKLSIDLVCPNGLFFAEDSGTLSGKTIQLLVHAQQIDDAGTPLGGQFLLGGESLSAATNTAQRRSFSYAVPAGRYRVAITRTDVKDTNSRAGHTLQWVGLRSHLVTDNEYGDVTLIATKMRATNNLSQQSSRKVNAIATRKLPLWNGSAWSSPTATRSIAWAIAYICKKVSMVDSRIDLAGLLTLHAVWEARGDHFDFRFDSGRTFWESVQLAATAGRAKMYMQGGIMYCWRDQQQSLPSVMFSMRNIVRNSFSIEFITPTSDTADAVDVTYFDDTTWSTKHLMCKLPDSTAEKPAKIELSGVTNRAHAYREGLYRAAANRYRRTMIPFQVEMEGYMLSYGSLASVQHDLPQWGQHGEAVAWDGTFKRLTVSEPLVWEATGTHYIALRRKDGSISGPYVATVGPSSVELDLALDPEVVDAKFTWNFDGDGELTHIAFGVGSLWSARALVASIKPSGDSKVSIVTVLEDDRVHAADGTSVVPGIPAYVGLPKIPKKPVVSTVYVSQDGNPSAPVINVSWPAAPGADFYRVEWSSNGTDWNLAGESAGSSVSFVAVPGIMHVRVRGFGEAPGPWASWVGVTGVVPPPGVPSGLVLVEAWLGSKARWMWGASARALNYDVEIYAAAALRRSFSTTSTAYEYDHEQVIADGGPWRSIEIKVRAVGPTGTSSWASLISVNPQVGALDGLAFVPGFEQVIGTYLIPADTDFSGVRVAMSLTSGFDQNDPANLVYDGYDQIFVLTQGPLGAPFVVGAVWYLRAAGYDKFGADSLTWSSEHQVTLAGVEATMTPEQILAALNSSFVQGNVVLAGAGAITVYNGAFSVPNRDFVLMTAGGISFQRYRGGQYREYKSLKRVESGSSPSGQTVTLPGYWDTQPKVTVSPQSLKSYAKDFSAQDQTWACRGDNLREDPAASGIWKFDTVAELHLASNAGSTSINQATGDTASNSWNSSQYTLPPNTHDITINYQVKSKRGTGNHTAEWAYRAVTVTVYSWNPVGGWVVSGSNVKTVGSVLDTFLSGSVVCANLAAGTTAFYVNYSAYDVGGSWYASGDVYDYTTYPITGSNGSVPAAAFGTYGRNQNDTRDYGNYGGYRRGIYNMPAYSPPAGWEVTGTSYTYTWTGKTQSYTIITPDGVARGSGMTKYGTWSAWSSFGAPENQQGSFYRAGAYDVNAVQVFYAVAATNNTNIVTVDSVVATVNLRYLYKNSATQVNAFTLSNYAWQIASASALSVGSINWMATGD